MRGPLHLQVQLALIICAAVAAVFAGCTDLKSVAAPDGGARADDTLPRLTEPGSSASNASPGPQPENESLDASADARRGSKPETGSAEPHRVRVLATAQTDISGIYSDGKELFFTVEDGSASVRAVKLDGSGLRTVAAFHSAEGYNPFVGEITEVLGKIAWSNVSGGVFLIDKAGAKRELLSGDEAEAPLATDGKTLFFANHDSERRLQSLGAGAQRVTHAKYVIRPTAIAVDGDSIFWSERGPLASANGGIKTLKRNAPAGAEPQALYKDGPDWEGSGLALSATHVFFAEAAKRRVARVPKVGGAAIVVADSLPNPVAVRIEGGDLFVLDAGLGKRDGALYRLSLTEVSARPTLLATGLGQPLSLVVDAAEIYIACAGTGEVVAVQR
jgi:hypothetical protein